MKKILITLMLLVGAFSGFSQTFDFSCGPDRMGTGWELYVGDSLVIDNVTWPWEQDGMYYNAPESEYNVGAIAGLGIGRSGTQDGDFWNTRSNGVNGRTWTGTAPDRASLQTVIDWVRAIPYIVANPNPDPNMFDHPGYEGSSSYVNTTNNVIVEGVAFEQIAGTSRRYSPDGWAGPSPDKIVIWRGSGGYHLGTRIGTTGNTYSTLARDRDLSFEDVIRKALTYKADNTFRLYGETLWVHGNRPALHNDGSGIWTTGVNHPISGTAIQGNIRFTLADGTWTIEIKTTDIGTEFDFRIYAANRTVEQVITLLPALGADFLNIYINLD